MGGAACFIVWWDCLLYFPFLAQSPKRHHDNGQRRGKAQVTAS